MFLLLSLFSQIALCADEKTYYIGTEPNGNGTGTVDDPLPNDIEKIKEALRNSDKSVVNLYFTEGFHYFNNTGIMGWDYNQEIVHHVNFCGAGSGKSVLHGGKKLTGWKKSTKYQKLWELDYHDSVHSFYVNDRRARLGRAPNFWDYAQIKSYEVEDDPSNSSLVIKRFRVQKDCIRFLQKHTNEEVHRVQMVQLHTWYIDIMEIVDYDPETCIIVTKNSKELEDDLYQGFTRPRATDFYYLQNSIFAVTEPGEYFHDTSKGILYYYPYDDDDLETVETWMAVADHTLNFNGIKSATFQNLSFRYTTGVALGGILFSNLLVENCDFKHCETGLSILFSNNTVMNHLLFEVMGSMAVGFNGMLNSGLNNSIIRGFGRRIFSNGMNFWGENNFTYVTNCDFSDGFSSCIIYGDGAFFDNTKVQNTYLANNHMHHFGYRIVDDIGGFFFGQHPPGNVVDHNLVHDSYVHNYCGNGIYSDTGSNGAIVKNNLVYDADNAAWNMNGMEHEIFNNIFAYSGNKASHGETRDDHDIMSFHNNILYLGENDGEVASGSFTENSKLHFENNLYWREDKTSDDANLRFYGLSYDEWRGKGYDQNSFVADPLFTDPKKRDFSFKSTENAAKINFVPFNQTFGVVGDDWRKIAEDYSYHDCIILYPRVPLTGDESFERGENAEIFYRLDRFDNNGNIELTTEKAIDGTHSLKLVSGNENAHPEIKLHLGFTDGNGEISFKVFAAKGSIFWIDFWTGIWVEFRSSKLLYGWETYVGEYEEDKWITITGKCECHTENNTGYFLMIVDGKEYNVTVGEGMRPLEYWRLWLDPTSTVYFDDLHVDIDTPDPPFFDNEVLLEISDDTESSNNEDKKLKPGAIAGIVIAVIVVVVVVVVCIVFVLRKKRYDSDANMNV